MRTCLAVAVIALGGCSAAPEPARPDTGSRHAAGAFFTAIAVKDWAAAFNVIHPDSRQSLTMASFTTRAKSYRQALGFEPGQVRVGLCEEQGDTANAHITISDSRDSKKHRYREAIAVRRGPAEWGVIVPPNFGFKK